MGRYDFDKNKLDMSSCSLGMEFKTCAATLPRQSQSHVKTISVSKIAEVPRKPKLDFEFTVPNQKAPRPTTLPYRNSTTTNGSTSCKTTEIDSNPLRILRDKNYPIIRPRLKNTPQPLNTAQCVGGGGKDMVDNDAATCESPSYLTNTEYSFTERDVNIHRGATQKQIANKEIENLNPIPLPPRDRNKIMQTNAKRHVRKYPLIIPVSGLQRTLSKVQSSPSEENNQTESFNRVRNNECNSLSNNLTIPKSSRPTNISINSNNSGGTLTSSSKDTKFYSKKFIENNFPMMDNSDRTYENLDTLRYQMQDCTDSASLDFESILEDDCNKIGEMSSPDVANDFMFEIQKDHYRKTSTSQLADEPDEIRNLDIEKKKLEFSQKYPKYVQPKNELANNSLFNKVKELVDSVGPSTLLPINSDDVGATMKAVQHAQCLNVDSSEMAADQNVVERKLQDSNSVSCEDLLEFSDKKPKGRERGVESDEVRIMTKVLGTTVSIRFYVL